MGDGNKINSVYTVIAFLWTWIKGKLQFKKSWDCDVEPQKKVLKSGMKYVIVSLTMIK